MPAIIPDDAMTFKDWANQMSVELFPFGPVPLADGYDNWRAWVYDMMQIPAIDRIRPPDPAAYDTWQAWATEFITLFSKG